MWRWVTRVGLVGALALAVTACSSSDDDGQQHHHDGGDHDADHVTDDRERRHHRARDDGRGHVGTGASQLRSHHGRLRRARRQAFVATPAFCAAATEFDERRDIVQSSFSGDSTPTLARQAWDELDAVIAGLVTNAPELIAPDVDTARRAFAGLRGVFEAYGYDTQRLFDAAQADPELSATLRLTEDPDFSAASERIDAFVARACGTP